MERLFRSLLQWSRQEMTMVWTRMVVAMTIEIRRWNWKPLKVDWIWGFRKMEMKRMAPRLWLGWKDSDATY